MTKLILLVFLSTCLMRIFANEKTSQPTNTPVIYQNDGPPQDTTIATTQATESTASPCKTQDSADPRRSFTLHRQPAPWLEAMMKCWAEGGQLAVPRSSHEAKELGAHLFTFSAIGVESAQDALHVGIHDFARTNTWRTLDNFPLSEAGYNLWLEGGEGGCGALLADGRYLRQPCHTRLPFACEDVPTQAQALANNYTQIPGAGLFRLHEEPLPWVLAQRRCEEEGASLAVPASGREAGLLAGVLVTRAVDPRVRQQGFFVGITDVAKEGAWRTVGGVELEAAGYATWAPDEPSGSRRENCGALLADGRYADYPCLAPLAFCCKARAGREGSDADVEVRGRYRLHKTRLPWFDALRACQRENATLVTPRSSTERSIVGETMLYVLCPSRSGRSHTCYDPKIHVGIYDLFGNQTWTYLQGETDTSENMDTPRKYYSDSQTNDLRMYHDNGLGGCAYMDSDGRYGREQCKSMLPFICDIQM